MCISRRLKYVLKLKNINTIKEFSEVCGFPYRTAQSYLNGNREPNVTGLIRLQTQMDVNLNWLLTGEGDVFVAISDSNIRIISAEEKILLDAYDRMSDENKRTVLQISCSLSQLKSD